MFLFRKPFGSVAQSPKPFASVETIEPNGANMLHEIILESSKTSKIKPAYEKEVSNFVVSLLAHLEDFQMPDINITEQSMSEVLRHDDTGTRINSLVNEVWADWLRIGQEKNLEVWMQEPNDYGLSPFRQLVIKLIQNRQGKLANNQQHSVYNFFSRKEDDEAWISGIDGVIGAVNRESFQWPK